MRANNTMDQNSTSSSSADNISDQKSVSSISPHSLTADVPSRDLIQFTKDTRLLPKRLQDKAQLQAMIATPKEYGLTPNGLCHALIKAGVEGKREAEILPLISKLPLTNYTEQDSQFQQSALQWCAVFNYPNLAHHLASKGFKVNQRNRWGLTHTQTAVMMGQRDYVVTHFNRQTSFSELKLVFKDNQQNNVNIKLNELHLAIMSHNLESINDIFNLFEQKKVPISTQIVGVGNLLHLCVYVASREAQQDQDEKAETTYLRATELLQLILRQGIVAKMGFTKLLCDSSNFEECTPLMLAAKYNQVGLLEYFLRLMKAYVDEAQGLTEVQKAFYVAVHEGHINAVDTFVYQGFEINAKHLQYNETITYLAKNQHIPSLSAMFDKLNYDLQTAFTAAFQPVDPYQQVYENLVLQGGGGKGFAYPFTLLAFKNHCEARSQQVLDRAKKNSLSFNHIVRVVGTSAGAIFALGLALGFSPEEIVPKLDYDFADFLENANLQEITRLVQGREPNVKAILDALLKELELEIDKITNSVKNIQQSNWPKLRGGWELAMHGKGVYQQLMVTYERLKELNKEFTGFSSGKNAYQFLARLFNDKGLSANLTFGELAAQVKADPQRYKHLHVVVTNLTKNTFEVLSSENPIYKDYLIIDAVRASMSFPVVFKPHHLRAKVSGQDDPVVLPDEYIDGGVLRNYAIDEFDFKRYTNPDWPGDEKHPEFNPATIGFRFHIQEQATRAHIKQTEDTVLSRLLRIVSLYSEAEELISRYVDKEYHRSVKIDTSPINTFTFKRLTDEDKILLQQRSQDALLRYQKRSNVKDISPVSYSLPSSTSAVFSSLAGADDTSNMSESKAAPSANSYSPRPTFSRNITIPSDTGSRGTELPSMTQQGGDPARPTQGKR